MKFLCELDKVLYLKRKSKHQAGSAKRAARFLFSRQMLFERQPDVSLWNPHDLKLLSSSHAKMMTNSLKLNSIFEKHKKENFHISKSRTSEADTMKL